MELPDDVLKIISDFSRPVTRPDWRELKPMCGFHFHCHIAGAYNHSNLPVIKKFVRRYDQQNYSYICQGDEIVFVKCCRAYW